MTGSTKSVDRRAPQAASLRIAAIRSPAAGAVPWRARVPRRSSATTSAIVAALLASVPVQAAVGQQQAASSPARAALAGVVLDSTGFPISGARITIEGTARVAETTLEGTFRLADLQPSDAVVVVRRMGFTPQSHRMVLGAGATATLNVRLTPVAQRLEVVTVHPRREPYDARLKGFYARAESRRSGYFIMRERLDRAGGRSLPEVLREIPGVGVHRVEGLDQVVRIRGADCGPLVFVDGMPARAAEFDLGMLDLNSLEGVEVYPSMASMPAEFGSVRGGERCGVVAVWSRAKRASQSGTRVRLAERSEAASHSIDEIGALVSSGQIYTAAQVDRASLLDEAASPPVTYPDSLLAAGLGGRVLLELVVDTAGHVEPGTVRVISATDAAFGEAARQAILGSVFLPALRKGRPVRQLVQLPVVFTPSPAGPVQPAPSPSPYQAAG